VRAWALYHGERRWNPSRSQQRLRELLEELGRPVTAQALAAKLDAPLGAVELDRVALYARGLVEKVWLPGTTRFGWRIVCGESVVTNSR
jgi:hypothetical protein